MASNSVPIPKLDRYVVIHVATTCDEHGVYVTKDSAEVIELGWILLDSKNCDEVRQAYVPAILPANTPVSCTVKVHLSNRSIHPLPLFAVSTESRIPCRAWADVGP